MALNRYLVKVKVPQGATSITKSLEVLSATPIGAGLQALMALNILTPGFSLTVNPIKMGA